MEPFNIVGSSKNNIKLKSYHSKGNKILELLVKMSTWCLKNIDTDVHIVNSQMNGFLFTFPNFSTHDKYLYVQLRNSVLPFFLPLLFVELSTPNLNLRVLILQ